MLCVQMDRLLNPRLPSAPRPCAIQELPNRRLPSVEKSHEERRCWPRVVRKDVVNRLRTTNTRQGVFLIHFKKLSKCI